MVYLLQRHITAFVYSCYILATNIAETTISNLDYITSIANVLPSNYSVSFIVSLLPLWLFYTLYTTTLPDKHIQNNCPYLIDW